MQPALSVIIPVYNAERTLRTAIDSVLMQRCDDVEIVVVDDGSSDGSWEIIESYGDRVVGVRQENAGAPAARNHGARASRGQFLKFLDSDDFLFPESLRKQINHAKGLPERSLSAGQTLSWNENAPGPYLGDIFRQLRTRRRRAYNPIANVPTTAAVIYPRETFSEIGGFDESLAFHQDVDIFIRAIFSGSRLIDIGIPVCIYRQHNNPNRITQRRGSRDYAPAIAMYRKLASLMSTGTLRYPRDETARALAKRAWRTGRNAVRYGHHEIAGEIFAVAREIHPNCRSGFPPYKTLALLFGPYHAEAVWMRLRSAILKGLRIA